MARASTRTSLKRRKVIFVTGGSGRVGRNLIRALLEKGYVVRALAKTKEHILKMPSGVVPYIGDISDRKTLNEACKGADAVIHLAAVVSEYKEDMPTLLRVNVWGTTNVLEACKAEGIGQVIFMSTVDVYGRERSSLITEETEPQPTDKYGYSKMLAEEEVKRYGEYVPYTILRSATMYGPGFEDSFFKVFRAIREQKAYIIGNGENHLALVHVSDVIMAIMLVLENKESLGKVYNVGDGVEYTQKRLFELAAGLLHVEKPSRHISPFIVRLVAKRRGLDSDELRFLLSNRILSIRKIRKELGFEPRITVYTAGLEMVNEFVTARVR